MDNYGTTPVMENYHKIYMENDGTTLIKENLYYFDLKKFLNFT